MSDYTITTDFGAKDSLPSGNAAKIIKGSEFTTEFTNIKTAVNTKADTTGDTFTGAVTFDAAVTLNADVTFDTNTLFVDVSENKVGIGNVAPATALDVTGTVTASGLTVDTDTLHVDATNDRVGIGTNSPAELLHVTGASTAKIQITSTSATGISGVHFGDPDDVNVGRVQYEHATNHMALHTSDTERMRIDASGNVGIGTTNPSGKIHSYQGASGQSTVNVNANGLVIEDNANNGISILTTSANTGAIFFGDQNDNFIGGIEYEHPTNALSFTANNDERMRIDSSGNVGIGTNSPEAKLEVDGAKNDNLLILEGAADNFEFHVTSGDAATANTSLYRLALERNGTDNGFIDFYRGGDGTDGYLTFGSSGTERMRINSSGNVGIGTDSPDSILEVVGADPILTIRDTSTSGADSHATLRLAESGASDSLNLHYDISLDEGHLTFNYDNTGSNATERMRIDSSGNVLVGTTSATAMGTTNTGVVLRDNDSSYFARNSNGTIISFFSGLGGAGSISLTGNTANYNTTSDERLKENITDSADAGSKVDAIQIRQFDWKADGSHQDYGVIAQELINVAPEAVSEGDTEEDMMGVDYSKLVPMLIKEVQTLRNRVAQLENN